MAIKRSLFPFKYKVNLMLIALVITAIGAVSTIQYIYLSKVMEQEYRLKVKLLQDKTVGALQAMDLTYSVLEKSLEERMKVVAAQIAADYQRTGSPYKIDLNKYQKAINGMDVSIINSEYVIERSTNKKLLNLNYKCWPELEYSLKLIRSNGSFTSDRITLPVITNEIRKYSYLATGDRKYIIELSIDINQFSDVVRNVDFNSIAKGIAEENESICSVTLFSNKGKAYGIKDQKGDPVWVSGDKYTYFKQALDKNRVVEIPGLYENHYAHYSYIPIMALGTSDGNRKNIVEFVYNDKELIDDLAKYRLITLYVTIGAILLTILFGIILSNLVVKPVSRLMRGIDEVSEGNFNSKIDIKTRDEFNILGESFNSMIANIRELIEERNLHVMALNEKNIEIISQKDEISALYEQTTAMNEELEQLLGEVRQNYLTTVQALANSIEANDEYTRGHCDRVTKYSLTIGMALGYKEEDLLNLQFAGILHDIGKIGIPDSILNKDGKLTDEEYSIIKKHPEIGYNILNNIDFLAECRVYIWQHHERIDGKGYPNALKGDEIHSLSKVLSIADAYDAMTSSRPYRQVSLTKEQAVEQLIANKNKQFDSELVDLVAALIKEGKI